MYKRQAEYNKWNRNEKLVYLRNSLDKEVANVLWDYGEEVPKSLSELTKVLKQRFGGKSFADKHRIEIRNRRRKSDETLQSLHSDIRRLAALAFPKMDYRTREVISCDYFLDAMGDPDAALKIRERHPEDLDSALRIALQLEVWLKDSVRLREPTKGEKNITFGAKDEAKGEPKKTREIAKSRAEQELKKENEEQKKKIKELEEELSKAQVTNIDYPYSSTITCYRCGELGHMARNCSIRTPQNSNGLDPQMFVPSVNFVPQGFVPNGQFVPGYMPTGPILQGFVPQGQTPVGQVSPQQTLAGVRLIHENERKTCTEPDYVRLTYGNGRGACIELDYKGEKLSTLLDVLSDVTVAGDEVAKKYEWEIHEPSLETVANNEGVIITGVAKIPLRTSKRSVDSEILIIPDFNGFIIGLDWLKKRGHFVLDCRNGRVEFGDEERLEDDENEVLKTSPVSYTHLTLPTKRIV